MRDEPDRVDDERRVGQGTLEAGFGVAHMGGHDDDACARQRGAPLRDVAFGDEREISRGEIEPEAGIRRFET